MGGDERESRGERKLRLLCLHGFRTSGAIIRKQVTGKWPESVLQKLDLVFTDGPFPCRGKSAVEGIFDPPYYEWFQANKDYTAYENLDECLAYIEDFMIKNGPFDGLLGFSQVSIILFVSNVNYLSSKLYKPGSNFICCLSWITSKRVGSYEST